MPQSRTDMELHDIAKNVLAINKQLKALNDNIERLNSSIIFVFLEGKKYDTTTSIGDVDVRTTESAN